MATQSAKVAASTTLTADVVNVVRLSGLRAGYGVSTPTVTVTNRTGAAEIWVTLSATRTDPADPTVAGADVYCIPAAITSRSFPVYGGTTSAGVVVKLISTGAEGYTVSTP